MYDLKLYSQNAPLELFLRTLSYHRVGADFLANAIANARLTRVGRILDVGCGEGTFTVALLEELRRRGVRGPQNIVAFDPGAENVESYKSRLQRFGSSEAHTETAQTSLEDASIAGTFDLVICSHSLYGMLENPALKEREKVEQLRRVINWGKAGGLVFMSLAGKESRAYKVKRGVLAALHEIDRSVHGEELETYLELAKVKARSVYCASYMDVTRNLRSALRDCALVLLLLPRAGKQAVGLGISAHQGDLRRVY